MIHARVGRADRRIFSYVVLEARVQSDHPLRVSREIVNEALAQLQADLAALYSPMGRPSIAPEKLLRAMLLQAFYSIRSERQLMENRCGLLVDACLTPANGHAERIAALVMIERHADRPRRITLGADKAYDAEDFVNELRSMGVTPHVAQNTNGRRSAIDGSTTRHGGYASSQRICKRIEDAFGWVKTIARRDKTGFRGLGRAGFAFTFAAATYNLVLLPRLLAASP